MLAQLNQVVREDFPYKIKIAEDVAVHLIFEPEFEHFGEDIDEVGEVVFVHQVVFSEDRLHGFLEHRFRNLVLFSDLPHLRGAVADVGLAVDRLRDDRGDSADDKVKGSHTHQHPHDRDHLFPNISEIKGLHQGVFAEANRDHGLNHPMQREKIHFQRRPVLQLPAQDPVVGDQVGRDPVKRASKDVRHQHHQRHVQYKALGGAPEPDSVIALHFVSIVISEDFEESERFEKSGHAQYLDTPQSMNESLVVG